MDPATLSEAIRSIGRPPFPHFFVAIGLMTLLITFLITRFCAPETSSQTLVVERLLQPTTQQPSQPPPLERLRQPIDQQSSRLLLLPTELRLKIWRYVVPDTITITNQHPFPQVPSIGRACRQTLCETLPIFLRQSEYFWLFDGGDGSYTRDTFFWIEDLMDFIHPAGSDMDMPIFRAAIGGTLRWECLMRWAKAVHRCRNQPHSFDDGNQSEEWNVMASTLFIADKLHPLPWETAKEVLEALPAAKDPRWA